jgi:FkbM family methyltransferase
MSILDAIETYYGLFGATGLFLAAKARILQRPIEATAEVPGVRFPVYVRLRTTDVSVFRQVLVIKEYDYEFSKTPRVIVDGGANIGLTSVSYANRYPDALIVAVEPEPSNFALLKKNVAPYSNVIAIQAALWKDTSHVNILDPGLGHYGFRTVAMSAAEPHQDTSASVRAVTVDKLMADLKLSFIDILKIDIEGSEKELFEKSARWIDRIGVIAVELHDHLKPGCARSVYLAAAEFERVWRQGETVFFARAEYLTNESRQPTAPDCALEGKRPRLRSVPTAKILGHT